MSVNMKSLSKELLVPVCLFVGIGLGGTLLGRATDESGKQFFERGIGQIGELAAARLEDRVEQQRNALDFAAEQILPNEILYGGLSGKPGGLPQDFQKIGGSIVEWLPGFLSVNWIAPEGTIELVTPLTGNLGALHKNVLDHSNPGVVNAFLEARDAAKASEAHLSYTPVIDLYQRGRGFAVYRAVFSREGQLLGVLNASSRIKDLLKLWLLSTDKSGHAAFAVLGSDDELLFSSAPEATSSDWRYTRDLEVKLLNEPWRLRVGPTDGWLQRGLVLRGNRIAGVSLVLGLLVGALYFAFARKRRGQEEADLRLELALEGARLGVWDWDLDSGVLHLNDRWLAMLGYPLKEFEFDLTFYRGLVHPEDLPVVELAMEDHLAGRTEVYRTEHRLRARTGEWVWVLDAGRIVRRDGSGRPLRVAGTQTNFTDIRRAEQELERSVGRYRSIFEHSPIGMLEQDMSEAKAILDQLQQEGVGDLETYFEEHPEAILQFEGLPVTLDINPAFLKLFRATTVAGYRENVIKMVDNRARRAYEKELIALYRGERTCEADFPLRDMDGQELLYTIRLMVAPGCEDDLSSVFVSLVDNTRMLREEEQRRLREGRDRQAQKDESLALLAGGVAHDFNNLLVPIIGNIELAMHQVERDGPASGNLRRAEQAAQRAADLARQMLTYSGRGQVQSEVFDFNALVREMSDLLSASLPGKVDMVTDFFDGELGLEGDPTQLRQLVMNLVINAADAIGGEAGRVVVRTGSARPTATELTGGFLGEGLAGRECSVLEVRDTGSGVDEETIKRIFEPFFSTKSAGRGLGMSVVLGIVRGHGGALTVSSQIGKGTRIRAYMPLAELPLEPAPEVLAADRVGEGEVSPPAFGVVLFADDEPQVRRFAVEALSRIGVEVQCAIDGAEALEIWRASPQVFDLVILDATMPRMGGVETMKEIRAVDPGQPILLSSGYTLEGVASRAAESELCWFLPKPFGVSELTRLVRRVLRETGGKSGSEE